MENNKPDKELTDQMKKNLREAKTKEELDALVTSAGLELDDDQLDEVAGGEGLFFPCSCYQPNPACDEGPGPY